MNRKALATKVPDDKLADEMMRTADDLAEQTRSIAATLHHRGSELGHATHHLLRSSLDVGANSRWLRALIKEVCRRNAARVAA